MANPEHVRIVRQGAEAISTWKEQNPNVQIDLSDADLSGTDLRKADLSMAKLVNAHLGMVCLRDAQLIRTDLRWAELPDADLTRSHLNLADARWTNLTRANLAETDLSGANLCGAILSETDFSRALCANTILDRSDLSAAEGLETVQHFFPSIIGVQSIIKSKGKIPEAFLRGCGVPEELIRYLPTLVGKVPDFYTCFISFTEADDAFSGQLYNDLQSKGVRCWRWKEDAKWGGDLIREVDTAVQHYDKLIVTCSKDSLTAPAVLREIDRALQKEDRLMREGRDAEVLFPIRLDDYIFDGWEHHLKADVVKKNVGDFRHWTDADSYNTALERLVRDLRADRPSK